MRRGQNNGVHIVIAEQIFITVDEGKALLIGEVLRLGFRARRAMGKFDDVRLVLDRIYQNLSPPTETDNSCVDQISPKFLECV